MKLKSTMRLLPLKTLLIFFIPVLFANNGFGQHSHPPMPSHIGNEISADRILNQIRDLASPGFHGREMGTPGNHQAADWVSLAFSQNGLSALPGHDDFFLSFDIHSLSMSDESYLVADDDSLSLFEEFTSAHYGISGEFDGQPLSVEWGQHDQYEQDDIADEIVLISYDDQISPYQGSYGMHPSAVWADSLEAEAVILMPPSYQDFLQQSYRFEPDISIPQDSEKHIGNTVQPFVKDRQLETSVILATSDREDLFKDASSISGNIDLDVDQTAGANNVVGYLGDFEPDSPYIVVSAHLDGHGLHPDTGVPIFGANRNASGVSVLLEITNALQEVEESLEYPIIFAAWNGHERYHAGRQNFFDSVWTDHENLMSYINLSELSGQKDSTQIDIYGQNESSEIHPHIQELAEKYELNFYYREAEYPNNSGNLLLPEALSTQKVGLNGGEYTYTGRIHDSPDKINMRQVYGITQFSLELIWNLSTLYEPI